MDVRREYERGRVISVDLIPLGDNLAADAAMSATAIFVEDAADFDEEGGSLLINGEVILYTAVDDDTGEITLATGIAAAAEEGDVVSVYDPLHLTAATEKIANVEVIGDDGNVDTLEATIADHLTHKLDEGIRGNDAERVKLELDDDEWVVVDLLGHGDPDASGTLFFQDSTTVTEVGDQVVELTFEPIPHSEHFYWNGIYQPGTEWIRNEKTVTAADPGEVIAVGDVLTVEYAYRAGITTPSANSTPSTFRYYFPSLAMALPGPIVPPYGEMWTVLDEDEYTYRSILNPSPLGVTDLLPAIMPEAMATPVDILRGQFIAEETLGAGTISGSMRMAMVIGTSNTDANSHLACRIYVVSNDGMTERGELFVGTASPESTTSAQTRKLEGSFTPVDVEDGDRIVVEIGAAHLDAIAALYYSSLTVGEGNSGIDLPFETDGGDASLRPWIELNLTWDA